jgi:hypothetical protein
MNQRLHSRQLEERWEASVARALEGAPRRSELDTNQLNTAAGLLVASGLQAGRLWGTTHKCTNTCEGQAGCGP